MKKLYFFLIALIFVGCVKQTDRNGESNVVNIDIEALSDNPGEFFDSYRYVMLEMDSTALISTINNIDINSSYIVVNCGTQIIAYDNRGNLISSFDRYGQGPEEYLNVTCLKIFDDNIMILSWTSKALFRYDMNGNHIATYKLPDYYPGFGVFDGKIWLASKTTNNSGYEFSVFNLETLCLDINTFPFDENKQLMSSSFNSFPYHENDVLYVTRPFDLTVYALNTSTGNVDDKWKFHFNTEKQLSDYSSEMSYAELYQATANQPVVTDIGSLDITDRSAYLMVRVFYGFGYFPNIYKFDPENPTEPGKLIRLGLGSYDEFPFLKKSPIAIYNHEHVSALDADMVLSTAEHYGMTEFADKGLTEESNPVLFFHHFK